MLLEDDKDLSDRGGFDLSTQVEGQAFNESFKTVDHNSRENTSLRRRSINVRQDNFLGQNRVISEKNGYTEDQHSEHILSKKNIIEYASEKNQPSPRSKNTQTNNSKLEVSKNSQIVNCANFIFGIVYYVFENYLISKENMQQLIRDPKGPENDVNTLNSSPPSLSGTPPSESDLFS